MRTTKSKQAMKFKIPKKIPSLSDMLELDGNTFGDQERFSFHCLSLSTASMLLLSFKLVPFNEQTILELSIDPYSQKLPEPISCCVRINRIEKHPSPMVREFNNSIKFHEPIKSLLSVQITQISSEHHQALEKYFLDLILGEAS